MIVQSNYGNDILYNVFKPCILPIILCGGQGNKAFTAN